MNCPLLRRLCLLFAGLLVSLAVGLGSVHGQDDGNGDDDDDDQQPAIAGVEIDAAGVLRVRQFDPRAGRQRVAAARQQLPPELARPSQMRKISLNRLEAAVADRLAAGLQPSDEMTALAGLTGVEFVFFYPETGDIVLAGPAEGFAPDASGRVRGIESGRPTLLLEDLVVALRAYPASGDRTKVISVSIDPTPEGLARLQQFQRQIAGRIGPADAWRVAQGLRQSLGLQNVSVRGVPAETHFAQVLVEADYRMKLVGIGLERLPVPVKSYVERASAARSANALQRWYFVPDYDCVHVSEDGLAMRLSGGGVKLVGADERVQAGGQRVAAARGDRASQAFCQEFTEKFDAIADRVPVYAQLRNMVDLSIATAFIQQQDYYVQAGWDMGVFAREAELPVQKYPVPHNVETAVNAVWKGNTLMTPLGGGVHFQPRLALNSDAKQIDRSGQAAQQRAAQQLDALADSQWWWD